VDSTWIAELKKPRSGYAGVTIKRFFQHLRSDVAKLTNKEKKEMRKKIEFEWDQTMDIKEYFDKLDREAVKLDRWEIDVQPSDLVVAGVDQMQDSGIFDHKFLRTWEMKPENEKTWQKLKDYFIPEYRSIKTYEGSNKDVLEKMQNVQEEVEVSDFLKSLDVTRWSDENKSSRFRPWHKELQMHSKKSRQDSVRPWQPSKLNKQQSLPSQTQTNN
jgi:hypothetical protein